MSHEPPEPCATRQRPASVRRDRATSFSATQPRTTGKPAPADTALHAHIERQNFQLALEDRLRELQEPAAVTAAAAEALGRQLGVGQVAYADIDEAGERAIIERDWNDGTMPSNTGVHRLKAFGPAFIADLKQGKTVAIGDIRGDSRTNTPKALITFERASIAAFLNVPLVKNGHLVAVLALHHPVPRHWSAEEISLAEAVAERTWAVVERARAESERDRFFDLSLDMLAIVSPDGRWRRVNPAFETTLGWAQSDLVGQPAEAIVHPEDRARSRKAAAAIALGHPLKGLENRIRCKNGRYRWIAWSTAPATDQGLMYSVGRDVTDRRANEAALRTNEALLRRVLDQIFAFVGVLTLEGVVLHANRAPLAAAGIRLEDVVGKPFDQVFWWSYSPAVQARLRAAMQRAAKGEAVRYDVPVQMAEGRLMTIDFQIAPMRDDEGQIIGLIPSAIDIDQRKRAEAHRELLINELNHRVKNTLAVVQGIALQTFTGPGVANRMAAFQSRLSALAAAHNLLAQSSWEKTSLEALARRVLTAAFVQDARIELAGPPVELPPRHALTLAMALHELCTNAIKYGAFAHGSLGRVTLSWSVSTGPEAMLHLVWREHGGPRVSPPQHKGFGSRIIERALAQEFDGTVTLDFHPEGLVCTLVGLLPKAVPSS